MNKRVLTISYMSTYSRKEAPFIRLTGRWLEKLGFTVGKRVVVQENEGKLILEVLNDAT